MGLSKAQGMAIVKKKRGDKGRIFVLLGDGELQEGQNIEALRNIRQKDLKNIVPVIDSNGFQCNDETWPYYYRERLFEALGYFYAGQYNGHDFGHIKAAFADENVITHAVIDFETSKGIYHSLLTKNTNKYHAGALKEKEYQSAIESLKHDIPATVKKLRTFKRKRERLEMANGLLISYNSTLCEIIKSGEDKVLIFDADLCADCGISQVRKEYPQLFYQFGISEQDMVSAAGGAALAGFVPIVNSFAAFLCRRANEQIYNNCTEGKKIIYVGALAWALPPGPGVSHECINDVEIMQTMPGLTIYKPYTGREVEIAVKDAIYKQEGPAYIRIPCLPTKDRLTRGGRNELFK
jgi:transketolase